MSVTSRVVQTSPDNVWRILADGWMFPLWVVGASRIREVDESWPAPGSDLHHSIGVWPMLINDSTSVLESTPGSRLVLQARGWPAGEATVTIDLTAVGPNTKVDITEVATAGPGTWIPRPLLDPPLHWRNTEALRRLAFLAERREQ